MKSNLGAYFSNFYLIIASIFIALITACGGGGGGNTAVSTGQFVNAPAKGVSYRTSSGLSGVTDANGNFQFRDGDTVSFSLDLGNGNELSLGSATGGTAVSVLSLSGNGIDPLAVSQVLQTLDASAVSGSMDLSGIVVPSNIVQNIQSALVSSAVADTLVGIIATSVHTALPSRGQKNPEGVSTLEALSTLAQQPANQTAVLRRIKEGVGGGLLSEVEDKPAFVVQTIVEAGIRRTELAFTLLENTGLGIGDFFFDDGNNLNAQGRSEAGSYTYTVGQSSGQWWNWDNDGSGEFVVKGVDLARRQFALEYRNDAYQETGSITGKFLLAMQTSDLVGKTLTVRKACADGSDALITFAGAAEANGFDVSYTSSCFGAGFFKPLISPSVFNGYVLQVTGGEKTLRIGLLDYRDASGARSSMFGSTTTGSGRFVVIPEARADRSDKPQFFDFSH